MHKVILASPISWYPTILWYRYIKIEQNEMIMSGDGSGLKFFWPGSGRVGSAIYGLGLNLENFY